MHNELQIMVAKDNPKKITSIKDLAREDVRTSMPNPINEGIMQFYIRKVLERHGFTAVHQRETPDRLKAGQSDAGVVWTTEVLEAHRAGADVDAVSLPDEDSLRADVAYVIGAIHRKDADARFLAKLSGPRRLR